MLVTGPSNQSVDAFLSKIPADIRVLRWTSKYVEKEQLQEMYKHLTTGNDIQQRGSARELERIFWAGFLELKVAEKVPATSHCLTMGAWKWYFVARSKAPDASNALKDIATDWTEAQYTLFIRLGGTKKEDALADWRRADLRMSELVLGHVQAVFSTCNLSRLSLIHI